MALYVFTCTQCGARMETLQKFDDPAPVCGCGFQMKRELSNYNFHLKGSGWAKDGYSKSNSSPTSE